MKNKQAVLFALALLVSTSAQAESPRTGMHYTARSPALKEQGGSNELRTLTYARPDATPVDNPKVQETRQDGEQAPKTEDQTASDKVWEKYKSLATGQNNDAEVSTSVKAPTPPTPPQAAAPAAPVGLAGILQEYQKTKASRSEMRTLVITNPEEAAKIEAAHESTMETHRPIVDKITPEKPTKPE